MQDVMISFKVSSELVDEADDLAQILGVSRSEVLRRAIAVYTDQARPVIDDLAEGNGGLWMMLFGPRVRRTGDETDELFWRAMTSLANRGKAFTGALANG